jgi:hypothetical protein
VNAPEIGFDSSEPNVLFGFALAEDFFTITIGKRARSSFGGANVDKRTQTVALFVGVVPTPVRASGSLLLACSGDMNATVPSVEPGRAEGHPLCGQTAEEIPLLQIRAKHNCASRLFQRFHASSRAFLLASLASGASPGRMNPCPAPSIK